MRMIAELSQATRVRRNRSTAQWLARRSVRDKCTALSDMKLGDRPCVPRCTRHNDSGHCWL